MTVTNPTATETEAAPVASTGSRGTRILGLLALVGSAAVAIMGLIVSPADRVQKDSVRLFYIHVPVVMWMYVAVFVCAFASAMWLRKRTDGWDALAAAAAEVATLFVGLGLLTGMIWGRPTWGVYWIWDARLTSTAMLFVLLLGYSALRRYPTDPTSRSRMAAILGLLLVPNAAIVHYSVDWWRGLHQGRTFTAQAATIEGSMLFTFFLSMIVFGFIAVWLIIHRFRVAWLEGKAEGRELDVALADRRADADPSAGIAVGGAR